MKLDLDFYKRKDVVKIARKLLGKSLFTRFDGKLTGGIITETEAYAGVTDRASHAFGSRRTARTEIMYMQGGTAYVYLCYGVHSLFNVVTNIEGVPHAVLIRAIFPTTGLDTIRARRNSGNKALQKICAGPGTVSSGLGIHYSHTGISLLDNKIWIEDKQVDIDEKQIITGPRVGVDYAGKDALLPYRFILKEGFPIE